MMLGHKKANSNALKYSGGKISGMNNCYEILDKNTVITQY